MQDSRFIERSKRKYILFLDQLDDFKTKMAYLIGKPFSTPTISSFSFFLSHNLSLRQLGNLLLHPQVWGRVEVE